MQRAGFTKAFAVTPHDTDAFAPGFTVKALYIGVVGDVTVNMAMEGTAIKFESVPAGTILPISVKRVKATGTAAQDIVALGD